MGLFRRRNRREQRQQQVDTPDQAVERLEMVLDLSRRMTSAQPGDPGPRQSTASVLYLLGSMYLTLSRPDKAIDALDEAEEIYRELGREGVLDSTALVADVRIRRATALSYLGKGASAVCESAEGVRAYLALDGVNPEQRRDLARVLARNSLILARHGDPSLAVRCADTALRGYVSQSAGAGRFAIDSQDAGYLTQAAAVATLIYLRHGPLGRALQAAQLAVQFSGDDPTMVDVVAAVRAVVDAAPDRTPDTTGLVAVMRTLVGQAVYAPFRQRDDELLATSLAGALAVTGKDPEGELATALTGSDDDPPMTPVDRCGPELAPGYAAQLAAIALEVLPTEPVAGIRIGLEAHYLFAGASQAQVPAMRYQLSEYGPDWARVLLACSAAFEARHDLPMAVDLASWAAGVGRQLMPLALTEPGLAGLAGECIERHGRLLVVTGERAAGQAALALAAAITRAAPAT